MRPYGCGASVRVGAIVHEGCEADEPREIGGGVVGPPATEMEVFYDRKLPRAL
jgi:hypothetical protein